jgi:type IV pilus assembly protein PilW
MFWLRKCSTLPSTGICTSTSDGGKPIPSLVVTDLSSSGTNDEVVAEGIEMMKIDYGVDTDADGSVDHYYAAAAVTNWSQVLTVRIGLIVRGDTLDTYLDTDTYNMPSGYTYPATPFTTSTGNFQRRLVVKELMVRNRVRRG